MFFLQLRQLIWKNFIIRKRSKFRLIAELAWPVFLFAILALVRTRGLKSELPDCFLRERALPSAGSLVFLQSFICTLTNDCHSKPPQSDYNVDHGQLLDLILNLEVLSGQIADKRRDRWPDRFGTAHASTETEIVKRAQLSLPFVQLVSDEELFLQIGNGKHFSEDGETKLLPPTINNIVLISEMSQMTIGKLAAEVSATGFDSMALNLSDIQSLLNATSAIICGNDTETLVKSDSPVQTPVWAKSDRKDLVEYPVNSNLSTECNQLFAALHENKVAYQALYPIIRGKIIYSPKGPAFDTIVQMVNSTFKELQTAQKVADLWLSVISPEIRKWLDSLENTPLNITDQIDSIYEALDNLDKLANVTTTYIDCYEFDKFEGYETEVEAVKRGMDLINSTELWAVIAFQHEDLNVSAGSLPSHVKYKIRMESYKTDSTKLISDFFDGPRPRNHPRWHMKYFTSGFIFLQDLIEQAIIKQQTGATNRLPRMFMQQFPHQCFIFDTFFEGISNMFPLFMILSFVLACSMTIKSIVREKELRLKETMRTMGLGNGVHWLAWFIDSMSSMTLSCIFLSLILYGKILEHSDFFLVLLFCLSFSIATICQSFLISTFFNKANLAAACGGFIFLIGFLPYNIIDFYDAKFTFWNTVGVCLLSNVAFGIGSEYLANYELLQTGAQWSNWAKSPMAAEEFSFCGCIVMLLVDSIVYLILTWYIEAVFPGQYGVPRPFYFMFQPSYWFPGRQKNPPPIDCQREESDLVEEDHANVRIGVSIRNLGKTYSNGKEALRNLSLDFYEDQITAFLGHNGAGKTTTISILTGLYTPSSGTATINGLDIGNKMDDIRQQLGLCPQYNVLFDELTVEEHLLFYANLKSGERVESRKEIDQMIDDLGLSHKRNSLSVHLSGGMKRKLSIGAAFIGGSKTVILDEPTAGVDPYSRRSIWDILLKYKTGRTIILTTHFMDEADMLGDRIAIIAQGQLKCCGSSLFLKRRIGSGYYLTLVRTDSNETSDTASLVSDLSGAVPPISTSDGSQAIEAIVQRHIPNAIAEHNVGSDFVFCLPELDEQGQLQRQNFARLFDDLDANIERFGFSSYGVSDTTLEEIFLKVANDPSASGENAEFKFSTESSSVNLDSIDDAGTSDQLEKDPGRVSGYRLILQQIMALYLKRFHNSRRSLKAVILPAIFIVLTLLFMMVWTPSDPEPPLNLNPWLYGDSNYVFYANRGSDSQSSGYTTEMLNRTGMGVRCTKGSSLGSTCWNETGLLNPQADPDAYEDILCPCSGGTPACPANASNGELYKFKSVTGDTFYELSDKDISLWILRSNPTPRYGGFEFEKNRAASNLSNLVSEKIRVWFNNQGWVAAVGYLNAINNVILRSSLSATKNSTDYGIEVINHPMNYTDDQLQDVLFLEVGVNVMTAIAVVFSMSFVPASFTLFLVEERSSKAKHMQFVSGVKPITFWMASYTWDMMNYLIPTFLIVVIFVAFDSQPYISQANLAGLVILLVLYGFSSIPLMYPTSLFFEVPSSAFVSLSSINLFIGVVTTITSFLLPLFNEEELDFVSSIISKVFLIFPHYCLGMGLIDLTETHYKTQQFESIGVNYERNLFEWDYLGQYMASMIIQGIVFFTFNLLLHYKTFPQCNPKIQKMIFHVDPDDEDVARERLRVENDTTKSDSLLLSQLTKVYNGAKRPAVNRLSFGVRRGECFGLLGVNGAGKSTTFKMLTGDEAVTHGNAWVGGKSVLTELEKARRNLGYCPQEDALLPRLTGAEHLQLFARLRGIRPQDIDQVVSESLRKLSLVPYKDRCAGTYSGGNKRKLSTAVSLIGNPTVVFLDEPSSGMDPGARRSLWDAVLKAVRDSQSVLLTSHSMEECQVLCTRLAIMVNGTLKCLGSPQHLKNRFGNGYMINVRCKKDSVEQVLEQVRAVLPEGRLRERRHCQLVWHVQPGALSVAAMFIRMEAARSASEMVDYSISQTTLDDVFIRFASQQRDDNDDTIVETDESLWQNEHPTKSDFSAKL
nr:ABCA1-1 protein [Diaphanosoma celebensis]